jgi:hypothetical protein
LATVELPLQHVDEAAGLVRRHVVEFAPVEMVALRAAVHRSGGAGRNEHRQHERYAKFSTS